MSETHDTSKPKLTAGGIKSLQVKLQTELAAVESSNAGQAVKDKFRQLNLQLDSALGEAARHPAAIAASPTWGGGVRGTFQAYVDTYKEVYPETETGSCTYRGGCIASTEAQCEVLGGEWQQGGSCP
jgi:hypothetical protein